MPNKPEPSSKHRIVLLAFRACLSPHGTRNRYQHGCRCVSCRSANSRYSSERHLARKRGDFRGLVSAGRAFLHLWGVLMSFRKMSVLSGVSATVLQDVRAGRRQNIRADIERAILLIPAYNSVMQTFGPFPSSDVGSPCLVDIDPSTVVDAAGAVVAFKANPLGWASSDPTVLALQTPASNGRSVFGTILKPGTVQISVTGDGVTESCQVQISGSGNIIPAAVFRRIERAVKGMIPGRPAALRAAMDFQILDDGSALATITGAVDIAGNPIPFPSGAAVPVWSSSNPVIGITPAADGMTAKLTPAPGLPLASGVIITASTTLVSGQVLTGSGTPIDVVADTAPSAVVSFGFQFAVFPPPPPPPPPGV
jgi:hypothetical protein